MNYFQQIPDLAVGGASVFRLVDNGKARRVMVINIIILGISFGLSNMIGILGRAEIQDLQGRALLLLGLLMICYGIVTMFVALFGMCLIYWAAAKALGGSGGLLACLQLIGLAAVPLWFLAPLLNYALRYSPGPGIPPLLLVPLAAAFIWSFWLLKRSLIFGQRLSDGRAILAVAGMWIFSVSAIYVFLP